MHKLFGSSCDTPSYGALAVLLTVLLLPATHAENEAAVSMASIPRVAGKITVDGALDEESWKKARVLSPLVKNGDGGRVHNQTRVRIFASNEALYLGWEVDDDAIEATLTARDSHFWEEEVVEFFLSTSEKSNYFEFQWNPLGGIFDAKIRNRLGVHGKSKGIDGDWSYTAAKMTSCVRVDGSVSDNSDTDRGWTVEAVIPFSDLGVVSPNKGTQWWANFYRFNRGGSVSVEKQSWNPTLDSSFHQPSRFGILEFE